MSDSEVDFVWEDDSEDQYSGFEVTRSGDEVQLILSSLDHEVVRVMSFGLEDAETIGLAMFHASQQEERSSE